MHFSFPYGHTHYEYDLPDERIAGVLVPEAPESGPLPSGADIVQEAMEHPVGSPRLAELARGKKNIVLIASDHTRPVPSKVIFPAMLREIREGNPDAVVTVLIATGSHRETTRKELAAKFGEEYLDREDIRFAVHISTKEEDLVDAGTLPSGGKLRVNRIAAEADLLIAEGFIEPHFFAGFSGGRKSVLPGVCARETVAANHCADFIDDPHARTGVLTDNPIHKDMLYAAEKLRLAYIVNVVLDENKRIIRAFAGDSMKAHEAGCAFVDRMAGVKAVPADIVITTNGGYPLDQNIYQSVKCMTAAEATCRDGGVIIILSDCSDGHGGRSFFELMANDEPLDAIMARFRATPRGETVQDQWQAQIFIRILQRFHVIFITHAPSPVVEALRMTYAETLTEALDAAAKILGRDDAKITVIPDGVGVIVHP